MARSVPGPPIEPCEGDVGPEQQQEVPFGFAHPPADRRQLDRTERTAQVHRCLGQADGAPAERSVGLPPPQHVVVDPGTARSRVRVEQLPALPQPATGRASPKRQARPHSQPRSSAGSPRWTSSQSSTAASPSWSTMRLPNRKSPWTMPRPVGSGGARPATGARTRRWARARRARSGSTGSSPADPAPVRHPARPDLPGATAPAPSRTGPRATACRGQCLVAQDALGQRLTLHPSHDHARRTEHRGVTGVEQHLRHRHPGLARERIARASSAIAPGGPGPVGGPRRSTSSTRRPSSHTASKDQL